MISLVVIDALFLVLVYTGVIDELLSSIEIITSFINIFIVSLIIFGLFLGNPRAWWSCFVFFPMYALWSTVEAYSNQEEYSKELYVGVIFIFYGWLLSNLEAKKIRNEFSINHDLILPRLIVKVMLVLGMFFILSSYLGWVFSAPIVIAVFYAAKKARKMTLKL